MEEQSEFEISAEKIRIKLPAETTAQAGSQLLDLLSPVTELVGYLGDRIRAQRNIAAARNIAKVREILSNDDRTRIETDPRFLIGWIDKGSEDVDGNLTDEWARLLISQSDKPSSLKRSFIDILAAIGPTEVRFLSGIYRRITTDKLEHPFSKLAYYGSQLADELELRTNWTQDHGQRIAIAGRTDSRDALHRGDDSTWLDENYQSLLLLRRLGLIDLQSHGDDVDYLSAILTPLGIEFVAACATPANSEDV